ncbi:hypothetical protein KGM_206611 [Danaus plexippus plexippus]|uniref:Uncharacterized protein n=1 Tax=Danaus plexippus plexippus TaxID=278856 RepID=A0A212EYI3_DANPL|nr:hypothetical protein KGM_206611 [Danaus plexippus plexippus]
MPLLSTLAALVIIVHTAEDNFEQNYRDLRPRSMDVGETRLEKPLRNMQVAPILTPSPPIAQDEMWDEINPDQPLRRRRRKRKRRPLTSNEDDLTSQERYIYTDPSRPYRQETKDTPGRRRKRIGQRESNDNKRWRDSTERERKRRRGQRRKRPNQDEWPELSEFNDYRQHEREQNKEAVEVMETRIPNTNYKDYSLNNEYTKIEEVELDKSENEPQVTDLSELNYEQEADKGDDEASLSEFSSEIAISPTVTSNNSVLKIKDKIREKDIKVELDKSENEPQFTDLSELNYEQEADKGDDEASLSEFSSEIAISSTVTSNTSILKIRDKIREKDLSNYNNVIDEKAKEYGRLDPKSLKSILKRSKGKSLSEILQQNNLTLADLLQGNVRALTALKKEESNQKSNQNVLPEKALEIDPSRNMKRNNEYEVNENINLETTTLMDTSSTTSENRPQNTLTRRAESVLSEEAVVSEAPRRNAKHYLRRRYPVRKQIRMRAMTNNTFKGQLSRDLIAQSALKYKNNRNVSRPREWKEYLPSRVKLGHMKTQRNNENDNNTDNITTIVYTPQESTTPEQFETTTDSSDLYEDTDIPIIIEMGTEPSSTLMDNIQTTTESIEDEETENIIVSEKSITSSTKPILSTSDLRRQVFTNKLKRKRQKQRVSTTEFPDDIALQHVFGEANFVSASEFIAKTQTKTTNAIDDNDFSTLEDFLTTQSAQSITNRQQTKKLPTTKINIESTTPSTFTTEETANMEIEEILNDSLTNARLTEILKERNMTLSELVAHRERGSSHLHLADIFHNASREPNPPEPFLTKSLIEPISKETYPLRALLEANLHDAKTTTLDPNTSNLNIPVVMDFGNNVNEIGENMGIISLFKNFSKVDNTTINDSYVINKDASITDDIERDGRSLNGVKDSVTWNDLIKLIQTKHQETNEETLATDEVPNPPKENLKDTIDDGSLVLEDLENLEKFNNEIGTDEFLEINLHERNQPPPRPQVEIPVSSNTRSVTVATISITGLALILFLLTYAALKWKQQSLIFNKTKTAEDACVPTPVFENRKTQKLNSSTRSKSPMLSSNIYTIDSIDPREGSESPEYMWDSLRKPYQ